MISAANWPNHTRLKRKSNLGDESYPDRDCDLDRTLGSARLSLMGSPGYPCAAWRQNVNQRLIFPQFPGHSCSLGCFCAMNAHIIYKVWRTGR